MEEIKYYGVNLRSSLKFDYESENSVYNFYKEANAA